MPVTSSRWERSAFGLVTPSQQLLYTLAFVAWPSINVLSVPRPHLLGGMMSTPKIPGFTAERSVYRTRANYRTMAGPGVRRSHEIDAVRLQACDLDCIDECQQGCKGLTGREHAQCIRLCRVECGCLSQPPVCGNCECNPSSGWSQRCCRPDGTACSRRPCTPPGEGCTVRDDRTCLPWPFDSICWGSCERTCCHWSGCDQLLCGVSEC